MSTSSVRRGSALPTVTLLLTVAALTACSAAATRAPAADAGATAPGFVRLFDGRTLAGWRGAPGLWSVEDGAITGRTPVALDANTFLIHEGTYRDFVVRLRYRFSTPVGNSGLQYRSRPDPEIPFGVIGYQANIVTTHADKTFAMLWDERARRLLARCGETVVGRGTAGAAEGFERTITAAHGCGAAVRSVRLAPEWNEYLVIARGERLVHVLNGIVTVDFRDEHPAGRALEGVFALQLHSGMPMVVQVRDIEVFALGPDTTTVPPEVQSLLALADAGGG